MVDSLKKQNNHLKEQIINISKKIESTLSITKKKKENSNNNNHDSELTYHEDLHAYSGFQQKISHYKDSINKLKTQMEGFYNIEKYFLFTA